MPDQRRCPAVELGRHLSGKPGLADARLPKEEKEPTGVLLDCRRKRLVELRQLLGAIGERCVQVPRQQLNAGDGLSQTESFLWVGLGGRAREGGREELPSCRT